MTLKVAIVGRPNVGKSTLFNRLAGRKIAIVDDQPGVTRDRKESTGRLGDIDMILVDTAGFEDVNDDSLETRMRRQTEIAIKEADVSIFLYDARAGVTPIDERFAQLLRKSGKPVVLAANKCEGKHGDEGLNEAWRLGLGDPAPISAEHGEGMSDLYEGLAAAQARLEASGQLISLEPEQEAEEPFDPDAEAPPEDPTKPIRIAFVGRPNAGKSTLLNGILEDDRFITGPEAGITRDSVTVAWSWGGREIRLVDTAGLRKRAKVQEKLERASTMETTHSIRFADVVVLVMDPRDAFEKQDIQIANLVIREGRGTGVRHHQVGHGRQHVRSPPRDGSPGVRPPAARRRHAAGAGVGHDAQEPRQADGCLREGPQGLVGPCEDARPQRLARLRHAETPAASAERQAHQAALHGADEDAPADLRADGVAGE